MSQYSNYSSLPSPPPSPRPSRRRAFNPNRIIPQLKRQEAMLGLGSGVAFEEELSQRSEGWTGGSQDSQVTSDSQASLQSDDR